MRENENISIYYCYGNGSTVSHYHAYRRASSFGIFPRFALGNWWSRYYKYTEESYMELMDRFEKENVPFIKNPSSLRVKVYAGADGKFELYEDDNETCTYEDGECVKTEFSYKESEDIEFRIMPAKGNISLIPSERSYTIELHGVWRS